MYSNRLAHASNFESSQLAGVFDAIGNNEFLHFGDFRKSDCISHERTLSFRNYSIAVFMVSELRAEVNLN